MLAELVIAGAILKVDYAGKYPHVLRFFERMCEEFPLFRAD